MSGRFHPGARVAIRPPGRVVGDQPDSRNALENDLIQGGAPLLAYFESIKPV